MPFCVDLTILNTSLNDGSYCILAFIQATVVQAVGALDLNTRELLIRRMARSSFRYRGLVSP